MFMISGLGYSVYVALSKFLSNEASSILAAFIVGAGSNINRQWTHRIAIAPILSGIMILVPGSLGIKGVSAFFDRDILSGTRFGFDMIVIALAISVGLFVSNFMINSSTVKRVDRYGTF
jgi:uncharacterized membrane protein YjjB (DUF3815 family)